MDGHSSRDSNISTCPVFVCYDVRLEVIDQRVWETIRTRVLQLRRPRRVEIRIPSSRKLMKNALTRQLFLGVNF